MKETKNEAVIPEDTHGKEDQVEKKEKVKVKKEKKKPAKVEIYERHYTKQWISITSILLFFIAFYGAYFIADLDISHAFVKSFFALIIINIIFRSLVMFWNIFIPRDEWMYIVQGPPHVDSRSMLKIREQERVERETDRLNRIDLIEEEIEPEEEFVLS